MQRFNLFYMIHKGLRAMMYELSISLQHTDFAGAADHHHSLEWLEHLLEIFDAHAGHEDKYVFPLLQACDPALQDEMEKEHVTDIALSNELRSLIAAYKNTTDIAEKRSIGSKICYTYYAYVAFNLTHMNKEETVVNQSLWNNYPDQQIVQANMQMVSAFTPDEVRRNAKWIMRGCSNGDISGWLGTIKKNAPEHVFNLLMSIAQEELPESRFEKVQNAVMAAA